MDFARVERISVARGMFAVLLAIAQVSYGADESVMKEKEKRVTCAATNGLVAAKTKPGIFQDTIAREAKRHGDIARALGATDDDFRQVMEGLAQTYNAGEITWEKIVAVAKACTAI